MEELIKLAASTKSFGLKGSSQYKNILKNKNCGDEIKIEFDLNDKKISNFRYEGEACIYCQASASLLSKNMNRLNLDNLSLLKTQIDNFFNQIGSIQNLEIVDFKPLLNINNKNRKNCIVLPIDAILTTNITNDC
ncbi:iron-sulfur cluster assembly scaffold protein [Pelagibacteraceae bacterium]|nr:iron-sulfur cluster assembly scaffold protein [Pelagibacteraceae bacterium]